VDITQHNVQAAKFKHFHKKYINVLCTNHCLPLWNAHVEASFGASASRCRRLHCLAAHSVMSQTHRPTFIVYRLCVHGSTI